MIELRHVQKDFGNAMPLKDISLTINDGEVVSIIGPSGTGKSTLLRVINMLTKPTSGQVLIDGEDVTVPGYPLNKLREKVNMVFQSFNLFDEMTVVENITFAPIKLKKADPGEAYDRAIEILDSLGIKRTALKYPNEISGGQKQRVAIARAVAMAPEVILFDEPTSALDPTMVGEVQKSIQNLCGKGYTILLVTHDMKFAEKVSTRTVFLSDGEVYEDGTTEQIFHNPQKQKTKEFINLSREFVCTIDAYGSDFLSFYTELDKFIFMNKIHPVVGKNIESIFEEMCFQILVPQYKKAGSEKNDYEISFSVMHSTTGEGTDIEIRYDETELDPKKDYPIPWSIIDHCAGNIHFDTGGNGKRIMRATVKE